MRSKETSDDYRYFPEPDLPPLHVEPEWLDRLRASLPELPAARRDRFRDGLGLSGYDAGVLVADPDAASLFEATLAAAPAVSPKTVANWVTGEYLRLRNNGAVVTVQPAELAAIIRAIDAGEISRSNGKDVLEDHVAGGGSAAEIIERRGFTRISDTGALGTAVDEVLAANPNAVADYNAGKTQVIGFLVGQVMKTTKGQADPSVVGSLLRERLDG
jgi:aspartyl-tRNA(Asn)/glutamyl-tRNA(Gln) amidotransferase subunit B